MKRTLIVATLALCLSLLAAPALAVPRQDLTGLARLFPDGAFTYVGFRTDDAYITTLDGLVSRAATAAGIPLFGQPLLASALDDLAASTAGQDADFASTIRPWLGDFGAFGVLSGDVLLDDKSRNDDEAEVLIAFETRGRAQTEAWIDASIEGDFTRTDDGDYTLYAPASDGETWIYVGSSLLLISNTPTAFPQPEMRATLADDADFQASIARLPADDYNILAYFDTAAAASAMFAQMSAADLGNDPQAQQMLESLQPSLQAVSGTAVGFTVLGDTSFTADLAVGMDYAALADSMTLPLESYPPIDPAFAARVPAGAPLVILGTNFAGSFSQGLEQQLALFGTATGADADQARQVLAAVRAGVQGVTGLSLEEVFAWATGQYAIAAGVNSDALSTFERNPVQFSLAFENVDGGAQALFDGLRRTLVGLDSSEISVTDKEIVGGQAVNVSIAASRDVPFPIDLQMAITADVLVLGTPDYVAAALAASGGLNDDPAFARSYDTALEDTPAFLYLATGPLRDLLALFASMQSMDGGPAPMSMEGTLAALESMNLSAGQISEDGAVIRAVITLAQ